MMIWLHLVPSGKIMVTTISNIALILSDQNYGVIRKTLSEYTLIRNAYEDSVEFYPLGDIIDLIVIDCENYQKVKNFLPGFIPTLLVVKSSEIAVLVDYLSNPYNFHLLVDDNMQFIDVIKLRIKAIQRELQHSLSIEEMSNSVNEFKLITKDSSY